MKTPPKPVVLVILDGWGYREEGSANAIATANIPTWNQLWREQTHSLLMASGNHVGLPNGQMGNSEVGHIHMGAGRLVPQDLLAVDLAIQDRSFFHNPVFLNMLEQAKKSDSALHVLGLVSPGGVHSHESHIQALLQMAATHGIKKLYLHAILDGRDTPPKSALASLQKMQDEFVKLGVGQIASIIGRYYAMDRDQRWERTEHAYDLYTRGIADFTAPSATLGLEMAYNRGESDEFVRATSIHATNQKPIFIQNGDAVIFMNFRADRARQISRALTQADFSGFERQAQPKLSTFVTLTEYASDIASIPAFPPQSLNNSFGEYIANLGLHQLRIAETEKYAHVTYFFNGGREMRFANEDRILVPSPKVATYDLQPEMNAAEVTYRLVAAIKSGQYDAIICNYANPDMVGHTGNMAATIKAIEVIDHCLAEIVAALREVGGEALITSDHGNAEVMYDPNTKQAHTAHTTLPVPLLYIGKRKATLENGELYDIAPTLLTMMGLPIPAEMTGHSLIKFE